MQELIRNFSIIAHIDHGKSTLADRLIQFTGSVDEREFHSQLLDSMDLERERGITIKASCVRLEYRAGDGKRYILNLIDTPGHVDFSYEVSKSLAACEGVLLVVDASQGVEAQTVANLYMAKEGNLKIIPIINKIDLANADPGHASREIKDILKLDEADILKVSAKEGRGIDEVLERIVRDIPPPRGASNNPLQGLIFGSKFDTYRGVIIYVRIFNGRVRKGMRIKLMGTQKEYDIEEVGIVTYHPVSVDELECGEVGYLIGNIRDASEVQVGDTITDAAHPAEYPLRGFKKTQPMVFSGVYPVNSKDFPSLRDAIGKLKLSDGSFVFEPESSGALGPGFRLGFLGLLHMEIVHERLEREFGLNLLATTPGVRYRLLKTNGEIVEVENPTKWPEAQFIDQIDEPYIRAYLIVPASSIGPVMELALARRGLYKSTTYLEKDKVELIYEMPLADVLVDFYDNIKSITRGYGSLDYELIDYKPTEVVKLDILINGESFDALATIVHKDKAYHKGRILCEKLREAIPRQLFEVVLQAAIGGQIIARERVRPLGKHVTGKCYGGDITRKRKLWEKQKEGKKKLKQFGRVEIPQEAFFAALRV